MNPLLDTVEPDWYGNANSLSEKHTALVAKWKGNGTLGLYSRETVEALLSQCRKEARREALLEAKQNLETLIKVKELIVHYTNERWHSAFARDWADDAASHYAKKFKELLPELRRMAADASSTLEGEKG